MKLRKKDFLKMKDFLLLLMTQVVKMEYWAIQILIRKDFQSDQMNNNFKTEKEIHLNQILKMIN